MNGFEFWKTRAQSLLLYFLSSAVTYLYLTHCFLSHHMLTLTLQPQLATGLVRVCNNLYCHCNGVRHARRVWAAACAE